MKKWLDEIKSKVSQWWPKAEPVAVAAGLALVLSLNGCVMATLRDAIDKGQTLTPEQIKAYSDAGVSVHGCFQLGGPPPAGNTQWIITPKNSPLQFTFGDNCHLVTLPVIQLQSPPK